MRPTRRARAPPIRSAVQMPWTVAFMNRLTSRKRWLGKKKAPGTTTSRSGRLISMNHRPTSSTESRLRAPRSTLSMGAAILAGRRGGGAAGDERAVEGASGGFGEVVERNEVGEPAALGRVAVQHGERLVVRTDRHDGRLGRAETAEPLDQGMQRSFVRQRSVPDAPEGDRLAERRRRGERHLELARHDVEARAVRDGAEAGQPAQA